MCAQPTPPGQKPATPSSSARHPLEKFSPEVRAAHERFLATKDPAAVDLVVLAVVRDFLPQAARGKKDFPDSARLMADLGFDSLAIAETVFFLEDLYKVTIRNEEIVRISTLGELRAFVRQKVGALGAV